MHSAEHNYDDNLIICGNSAGGAVDGDAWIRRVLSRTDANETDSFIFPLCAL